MGEKLRYIVESCLISRVADCANSHFQPLRLDMANSWGTNTVVHATRRVHDRFKHSATHTMLNFDLKKAFNLFSRDAFRERLKTSFLELLPWIKYTYEKEPSYPPRAQNSQRYRHYFYL